jgi:hypothetical protein
MTPDDLIKLLARGFIPENLPKPFNSDSFSTEYAEYESLLTGNQDHIPYKYDVYKKKYATRRWTLLNPYNFALLAKTLQKKWTDVQATLNSSGLSLTRIEFADADGNKSIKQMTKTQFQDTVFSKSSAMSVLLVTDIVEHYDSTYTHSVAWAMHDKATTKQMRNAQFQGTAPQKQAARAAYVALSGNIIDRVLRDGDEQQTHGIPTGPETSRIISEVVLSAVDAEFAKKLKDAGIKFVGGRYVDDYELYFDNERDADLGLQLLREVLNRYCYKVGEAKTYLLSGPPIPVDEEWRRKLRLVVPKPILDADDAYSVTEQEVPFGTIKHLIKEAVALTRENENPRIIKHALSYHLRKYKCPDGNWGLYEVYLLQMLANYPNTAKAVFDIIQNHAKGSGVNVATVLNRLLSSKNTTVFDAVWLLYGCLLFDVNLTTESVDNAVVMNDPVVWLMLTHLAKNGKAVVTDAVLQAAWEPYSLGDEGWLFKYEAVRQGWLVDTGNIVSGDAFWGKLLTQDVSFYLVQKVDIELEESDWTDDYEDFDIDPDFEPDPDWILPSGR